MEKIILYVDDASHACEQLAALPAAHAPVHWVLVACPPRMTHRISKWVSHSARENWRTKWLSKLETQVLPLLQRGNSQVTTVLAQGAMADLAQQLQRDHGAAQIVDARKPRVTNDFSPTPIGAPKFAGRATWSFLGILSGMGSLLVLANGLAD